MVVVEEEEVEEDPPTVTCIEDTVIVAVDRVVEIVGVVDVLAVVRLDPDLHQDRVVQVQEVEDGVTHLHEGEEEADQDPEVTVVQGLHLRGVVVGHPDLVTAITAMKDAEVISVTIATEDPHLLMDTLTMTTDMVEDHPMVRMDRPHHTAHTVVETHIMMDTVVVPEEVDMEDLMDMVHHIINTEVEEEDAEVEEAAAEEEDAEVVMKVLQEYHFL
mmetsp:Transcript_29186/g.40842  ORF Transcript_29186/g.40842 Transcript_29186/m.40842 type:complete len:216 (+) Transcript_29186:71-718(+)